MPLGWEEKAKELRAITRSRKIKNAEELLRLYLLYLTNGESFEKTSAILNMSDANNLNKNAVYERISKSRDWLKWLCENISRNAGELVRKPKWLQDKKCEFILRLRAGAFSLYNSEGFKVELTSCFEELKAGEISDKILFYKEKDELVPIRICGIREK